MAALRWAAVALGGAPFAVSVYALRGACAAAAAPETLRAAACEAYADWPVVALNLVYWPTFCLLFWVHSLAARSTWLIDPYWTLIPLYVYGYYASHPLACAAGPRQLLAAALLGAWSLRLSGNYWRRERYAPGAREDWRFADVRAGFNVASM